MTSPAVRTIGHEPDPATRLRKRWGAEMRYTRTELLGITVEEMATRMEAAGYPVTPQAISGWERGEFTPRPHHQIGWCKVTGRPHVEVFVMSDEAVA